MTVQKKVYSSKLYRDRTGAKASEALINLRRYQLELSAKINTALKSGAKTIPELADATGLDPATVFWYVMTYYKKGLISAVEKNDDGYYRYQ
ncbi:MAG: hypothetical protein QW839_03900, partial [Conexivisphaerales archaeon]